MPLGDKYPCDRNKRATKNPNCRKRSRLDWVNSLVSDFETVEKIFYLFGKIENREGNYKKNEVKKIEKLDRKILKKYP